VDPRVRSVAYITLVCTILGGLGSAVGVLRFFLDRRAKRTLPRCYEPSAGRRSTVLLVVAVLGVLSTVALAILTWVIWPEPSHLRIVSVTSPVRAGSSARLVAQVSPPQTCSITVRYASGISNARGLDPVRSTHGQVSWSWIVASDTTPGRWPISVTCGSAGTRRATLVVQKRE
jgi:hypothetical protein